MHLLATHACSKQETVGTIRTTIEVLRRIGVDALQEASSKRQPVDVAFSSGYPVSALAYGEEFGTARIDHYNGSSDHDRPLHMAAVAHRLQSTEFLTTLLDLGADPTQMSGITNRTLLETITNSREGQDVLRDNLTVILNLDIFSPGTSPASRTLCKI